LTHGPSAVPSALGSCVVVRRGDGAAREYLLRDGPPAEPGPTAVGRSARCCEIWSSAREPGEALLAGVRRLLREQAGIADADVWAVDLSGSWGLFACEVTDASVVQQGSGTSTAWLAADESARRLSADTAALLAQADRIPGVTLAFRPMTRADFPDVVAWQKEPHVARWWVDEATDAAAAERHYGPALDGDDATRLWIVEVNRRSVGFLQDYRIGDHPEYALLTRTPEAVGVDYAIGHPGWVGRGIGTRMLWTFLRDVVRPHYLDAPAYFAAPDHRNRASLRVLDKLGFVQGLWFDEPQPHGGVATVVGCSLDVRTVLGRL
jgi:aminoglycoside 6'-N-acetyltransferase